MAEIQPDEGKEKLKGGFKKLLSNIGKVIADAASLEVTTFTGNFEYKASEIIRNGEFLDGELVTETVDGVTMSTFHPPETTAGVNQNGYYAALPYPSAATVR